MPSIQINKGARKGKTGRAVDMSSNNNSEPNCINKGTLQKTKQNGFIKLNRGELLTHLNKSYTASHWLDHEVSDHFYIRNHTRSIW